LEDVPALDEDDEDVEIVMADGGEDRDADSPWTIEAVDEPRDEVNLFDSSMEKHRLTLM
jgi:hypothetical protein